MQFPLELFGHDPMVSPGSISACGATPVDDIRDGFEGATAVLFINEHPDYRSLKIDELVKVMASPGTVYDCWRMFDQQAVESTVGIRYAGIGYG